MKKLLLIAGLISLDIPAQSQTYKYSPYVPGYDVNLYRQALAEKQRQYDANFRSIQQYINDLCEDLKYARLSNEDREGITEGFKELIHELSTTRIDWGINTEYNKAMARLRNVKSAIHEAQQ